MKHKFGITFRTVTALTVFMELAVLLCTIAPRTAQADPKFQLYQRMLQKQALATQNPFETLSALFSLPVAAETQSGIFDQRINHDDPQDVRTFKQTYYVNSQYAENENSPVILYICGEAACSPMELAGAPALHAAKFKAHLITLEHRYYGKSQPFPSLTAENLKYLSTENALKDLAAFQDYATQTMNLKGKWLVMGGSYAGSLSAFYRLRYPQKVAGSLSSSGPVQARDNFEEYDQHIAKVAGPECAAAMRTVVKQVEATLDDPTRLADMKKLFGSEAIRNNVDFMYVIADMGAIAIQYGYRDMFCKAILQGDPVKSYAAVGQRLFGAFGLDAVSDSFQGAESLNPEDYTSIGMRQWMYQSCTEFGYWQTAYHDPAVSVRSPLIDQKYHDSVCDRLFGIKTPVDISKMNETLYRPLLDPEKASAILFTNGSNDPWSKLSITAELGNNTNPKTSYMTLSGAAHCDDLRGQSSNELADITKARTLLDDLATGWLAN